VLQFNFFQPVCTYTISSGMHICRLLTYFAVENFHAEGTGLKACLLYKQPGITWNSSQPIRELTYLETNMGQTNVVAVIPTLLLTRASCFLQRSIFTALLLLSLILSHPRTSTTLHVEDWLCVRHPPPHNLYLCCDLALIRNLK
jgi:hypothetical protein